MDLSIIIVNWNTETLLRECLRSIFQNVDGKFEVFVVDNHSADESVRMVKTEYPTVQLIENKENAGFAKANNQAIRKSTGKYVLLLNPDIEVHPQSIQRLLDFMDKTPLAGGVGAKLLNPDGSTQQSGFYRKAPSLMQVFLFYTVLKKIASKNSRLRNRYWEHTDTSRICEVDQPPGACLLVRREVIAQVGLMDEDFFLFFEDVDWCYRIKKAGWKLYFNPLATMTHRGGASLKLASRTEILNRFYASLTLFFKKHHSRGKTWLVQRILALTLWGIFLKEKLGT